MVSSIILRSDLPKPAMFLAQCVWVYGSGGHVYGLLQTVHPLIYISIFLSSYMHVFLSLFVYVKTIL